ncbi:MAG: PAS domain S-box protein [Dethiobacter sp.]|nr:PAS domain S-box protein [Dethiobacter sp.]
MKKILAGFSVFIMVFLAVFSAVDAYIPKEEFFGLFNEHGLTMLIIDAETGAIEYANDAAAEFYGYSQVELEGMAIQDINMLTDEEVEQERQAAALEKRNHFIFRHRLASGEIRTVEVYSSPYQFAERTLLFLTINDITTEKQLQESSWRRNMVFLTSLSVMTFILSVLTAVLMRSRKRNSAVLRELAENERKYKTLLANLPGMVYRCKNDPDWTMEYVSLGCLELTGYSPEDLKFSRKISFNSLIKEEYRQILWDKWQEAIKQETMFQEEYPLISAEGKEKWVWERGRSIYTEDGTNLHALEGYITDISEMRAAKDSLRENEEKLYATLLSVADGVITVDRHGRVDLMNPVAEKLTGWTRQEAFEVPFANIFNIIDEHTKENHENPAKEALAAGKIIELKDPTILISKDGKEACIEDSAAPIRDKHGQITGAVVVFRDCSEKREEQKRIEFLSYQDHLTGLYNRRFFEEELRRLDTARNLPLTIVMADVNGLKIINDAFGHAAGDLLLETVAEILKRETRADDIIARMGGDEFLLLLPKTDSSAAQKMIRRIKAVTDKQTVMYLDVSVSFGWASKEATETDIAEVMKKAEDFMYQKKLFESSSRRSDAVKSILKTLHIKNPREEQHSKRVSRLCEALGHAYDLSEDEIKELRAAGELHDIGKITIDEVILNKEGELSVAEWEVIKRHPEAGLRLLTSTLEFQPIAEYAFAHHERWDGTGYPRGLKGDEILWKARIMALADAYDAMTSERPYRQALSEEEAISEIKKNAGTQFDPAIARVFVEKVLGKEW